METAGKRRTLETHKERRLRLDGERHSGPNHNERLCAIATAVTGKTGSDST